LNLLIWHWGREGAGAKFTYELTRELGRLAGLQIAVSSANGSELSLVSRSLEGVTREGVPTFAGNKSSLRGKLAALLALGRLPEIALRFRGILRRNRIDLALCTFQSIWDIAALPYLSRGKVRFILILHDAFFHPGDEYPLRQYALRRQIRSADGLIVMSDHVARQAIASFGFPADRIWKMSHGPFSFGGGALVVPAVHPRGSRDVSLLFFGRIVAYKGLDLLLRAMALLVVRGIQVRLVIAGSGNLTPYSDLLKQLSCVTIHNRWLTEEEIGHFLAASDLAVLPYLEASQSGVAASAYAAGRPVVATPVGGLVEQVIPGETGLIARDTTADALADAIAELVGKPELLEQCARGALDHANGALSWRNGAQVVAEAIAAVHAAPRRQTVAAVRDAALVPAVE
jgi:glycosyltransferase involved in cell wall biosynthesis